MKRKNPSYTLNSLKVKSSVVVAEFFCRLRAEVDKRKGFVTVLGRDLFAPAFFFFDELEAGLLNVAILVIFLGVA